MMAKFCFNTAAIVIVVLAGTNKAVYASMSSE